MTPHVRYDAADGIAEITMARGPVNAVDHDLIDGVLAAFDRAAKDDDVRAVILSSGLDVFSAGMDFRLVRGATARDFRTFLNKIYLALFDAQYGLGKPTLAAIDGPARGAGVTLAVSCDIVLASEKATIGYPEIDVGLIPGVHFAHLPRQIGRHAAFELLFTGDAITAEEACALGFVNRVTPSSELRHATFDLARRLAAKPPEAMRVARGAFMRVNDLDYRRSIEGVIDTLCSLVESPETQERLRSGLTIQHAAKRAAPGAPIRDIRQT